MAVSPRSPRASLQEFQRLTASGDFATAAEFLSLTPSQESRGPLMARRLATVLEQRLTIDPRELSPLAIGDTTDGELSSDRLGAITMSGGRDRAVELVRRRDAPVAWMFSPSTVGAIDEWYDNLGYGWLRERLPASLMREGPLHVFYWQWIGLLVAIPVILLITFVVTLIVRVLVQRVTSRTASEWDDRLVEHLRGPFRLWVAAVVATPVLAQLDLNARLAGYLTSTTRVLVLLSLFWAVIRAIRLMQKSMEATAWGSGHTQQARTLAPLIGNILRVTVVIIAVLVALSQFGYPVGTLLAGLGIGGIAIALAAQKTVEHLFGSISLAADGVFRVGDWVRAGPTEGAVERIGLRSTSFRTHDRTVVRVPNGRLADERIETFGERDRILFRTDLDVTYGTGPAQLDAICMQVHDAIASHPKAWPDSIRVHVVSFAESAIRINVMSWFVTTDWIEFLDIRHALLLQFIGIVESNGSSFAFPSRTVYHESAEAANDAANDVANGVATGAATETSGESPAVASADSPTTSASARPARHVRTSEPSDH